MAGVIGDPVRHSLSPVLHNAAFAALGLDWAFLAFPVPAGQAPAALAAVRALGLEGLSVTMPHKSAVAALLDRASPTVEALGAANTVVRRGPELVGESTDGPGFLDALRFELSPPFEPAGARCLVVGAGGAARAVVLALAGAGAAAVVVANRSPGRARAAAALAGPLGRVGGVEEADGADLVVNATPLGMDLGPGPASDLLPDPLSGAPDSLPVPAERLGPGQLVVDLVYNPRVTPLLVAARRRGARTVDGMGMLVHQAAHAFTLWTGVPAPLTAMRQAVAGQDRDSHGYRE